MKSNSILSQLPIELQQQVINKLTAFDSCVIDFENGKYKIGSCSLRDKYPDDFREVGIIYNYDIFTPEEIKQNIRNL